MEDQHKRAFVAALYPGPRWKKKVAKMPDRQVFAIYKRELDKKAQGKDKRNKESKDDGLPF